MKQLIKNATILALGFSIFSTNIYASEIQSIENGQEQLYNQKQIIEKQEIINNNNLDNLNNLDGIMDKDLKIKTILDNSNIYDIYNKVPEFSERFVDASNFTSKNIQFLFENGDLYRISRINFKENKKERFEISIPIRGNSIFIRYVDPVTKQMVGTGNIKNLKNNTLFIDTDTNSYVISVPAVYKNDFSNSTLSVVKEQEVTPVITKKENGYELKISFPQNKDLIGEYWTFEADKPLINWTKEIFDTLIRHDLGIDRRWSYDGYYFQTPDSYVPFGKGILYKHPANYTGAYFIKNPINDFFKEMGYVMTKICLKNQNNLGYWETGSKSNWLEKDFKIGGNFYDTRFNTDFAVSLLHAYQLYNDKDFLKAAILYGEFFKDFASKNSYKINEGGILVQDYGWQGPHEPTHISLNHHLAEMNFLYELYYVTNEKSYLELANEMLLGVENTKFRWVLPDGNLNYALYYTKDTNKMVDYPYLTYNDLYTTKNILNKLFQKESEAINYLMENKKSYMDRNNIKGYLQ